MTPEAHLSVEIHLFWQLSDTDPHTLSLRGCWYTQGNTDDHTFREATAQA